MFPGVNEPGADQYEPGSESTVSAIGFYAGGIIYAALILSKAVADSDPYGAGPM